MTTALWIAVGGWGLTLIGWVATHFLTLRAQRRHLLHQVYNSARTDVTSAIRECQSYISRQYSFLGSIERQLALEQKFPVDWLRVHSEAAALLAEPHGTRWIMALEEYEILFPATREVRLELVDRQRALSKGLSAVIHSLPVSDRRADAIRSSEELKEPLLDQSALLEDLRTYLQNVTLHSITGNAVPYREPADANVPRILVDKKGKLTIAPRAEGAG